MVIQAPPSELLVDESAPWSVGLGAYGGLGLLLKAGDDESYLLGGGLLSVRIHYFWAGAYVEAASLPTVHSLSYGGAVGAFVPYWRWVDFDLAATLGVRTYSTISRYSYLGNYSTSTPAVGARVGVSDRAGEFVGVRVGAHIAAALDLDRQEKEWHVPPTPQNPEGSSGTTRFGGFSLTVAMSVGLELAPVPEKPAPKKPLVAFR